MSFRQRQTRREPQLVRTGLGNGLECAADTTTIEVRISGPRRGEEIVDKYFPSGESVIVMPPDELGGLMVAWFNAFGFHQKKEVMKTTYICSLAIAKNFPGVELYKVSLAFSAAWNWLIREGLVVPIPHEDAATQSYAFSRKGDALKSKADVQAYIDRSRLPADLLHPVIRESVWSIFMSGKYDAAVFQAFKQLEINVRTSSGAAATDIGEKLMRNAYGPAGR